MQISRTKLILFGWVMIITVIVLSLIPISSAMPDIKQGDKIGHFLAYTALMTWFAWLYPKPWVRNFYAIGFIMMGGILEVLQSLTAYRSMDIDDFHVNTLGVIAGFIIAVFTLNMAFIKKLFS